MRQNYPRAEDVEYAAMNAAELLPAPLTVGVRGAGVALALCWMLVAATPVQAGLFKPATGRWCALTTVGVNDCSYDTWAQCMATLSGLGGICSENPQYFEPPPRRKRPARFAPN